jgi:hypothetical protein
MKFTQFDNEHVAQAWERMKSMIKNCPTHGLTTWMIVQTFYAGLNFSLRNLLDSAAGGTFMSLTLGAATKLLDNMMVIYSEWHTERAPQGKNGTPRKLLDNSIFCGLSKKDKKMRREKAYFNTLSDH